MNGVLQGGGRQRSGQVFKFLQGTNSEILRAGLGRTGHCGTQGDFQYGRACEPQAGPQRGAELTQARGDRIEGSFDTEYGSVFFQTGDVGQFSQFLGKASLKTAIQFPDLLDLRQMRRQALLLAQKMGQGQKRHGEVRTRW